MNSLITRACAFAVALIVPAVLSGCDTLGLNGASSMRVEVEVYKGPLAKTQKIQKQELASKIEDSKRAFGILKQDAEISMCRLGCYRYRQSSKAFRNYYYEDPNCIGDACPAHVVDRWKNFRNEYTYVYEKKMLPPACYIAPDGVEARSPREPKHKVCPLLRELKNDLTDATALSASTAISPMSNEEAAHYADRLRSRANFWAVQHAAVEPVDSRIRITMANFAQYAADYGNQIGARADALLWQESKMHREKKVTEGGDGIEVAKRLALSLYLRDSETTDYLNLYDWNKAVFRSNNGPTGLNGTDRVRLVEQLVKDTYWSKINSVHASGQGDVRMAFIKDNIGNWNLKSFSNDPTKLLNAYGEAARAAIGAATTLAGNPGGAVAGAANIKGADRFMNLASRIATGTSNDQATVGNLNIEDLHDRTVARLKARQEYYIGKEKTLTDAKEAAETAVKDLDTAIKTTEDEIRVLEQSPGGGTPGAGTPGAGAPGAGAPATPPAPAPAPAAANPNQARIDELKLQLKSQTDARDAKQAEVQKLTSDIEELKKSAVSEVRAILHDHAVVVSLLQEAVVSGDDTEKQDAGDAP